MGEGLTHEGLGLDGLRPARLRLAGLRGWGRAGLLALTERPVDLFLFVPIFLSIGIGLWFALLTEPGAVFYGLVAGAVVALTLLVRFGPWLARPFVVALACMGVGGLACGARVWVVASPMLEAPYYGPIQGRIIDIDRSQSDAIRLTLDQVVLSEVAPGQTPATVRVAL
ncbi:MAG: hypothetical protein B7Y02_18000, partial [Rhodobacterales bacterium 17-64-5]